MLVIADSHIPYLKGVLEPLAEVRYLEPQEITADAVRCADVLFLRTRTRCDAQLLEGSQVKLILTATIGFDHICAPDLAALGISWANAPGCNAQAVCDWVEEALFNFSTFNFSTFAVTQYTFVGVEFFASPAAVCAFTLPPSIVSEPLSLTP